MLLCKIYNWLPACVGVAVLFAVALPVVATAIPAPAELQRLHDVLKANPFPAMERREAPLLEREAEAEPKPLADDAVEKKTFFTLNSVTFTGVSLYEPSKFLPIFVGSTGQKISVADLYELIAKITATYRNDGYILAKAILPPQDITAGHVNIEIVEGFIDQVSVTGAAKGSALVNEWANRLAGKPLNNKNLERYLLLMNDLPGVVATSTLKPAGVMGASDLIIHAAVGKKYSGNYGISNWGTRYVGPNQLEGELVVDNAYGDKFGWNDRTKIRGVQTPNILDLTYLDISHMVPLFSEGTTVEFDYYQSWSQPGYTLADLNIDSTSNGFNVTFKHPFIRSRKHNLKGFTMFDWRNTNTESLGSEVSVDRVRALRAGVNWDYADSWWGMNMARVEFTQGLGMLGASNKLDKNTSRVGASGGNFSKLKLDLARLQRLNQSINFLMAGSAQWASNALLAGEEFGVGGENFGRGYDTSEVTGDQGLAFKAELQMNFPIGWEYLDSWQLFGFYDMGITWQRDKIAGQDDSPDTLASWGFGTRTKLGKKLSADITLAKPLTRGVLSAGGSNDSNLYVRLKNRF